MKQRGACGRANNLGKRNAEREGEDDQREVRPKQLVALGTKRSCDKAGVEEVHTKFPKHEAEESWNLEIEQLKGY